MITEIDPNAVAAVSGGLMVTGIQFQPELGPQGPLQDIMHDDPLNAGTPNG